MKILLLGEFSAFHKNLKEGLIELGHDVTLISNGDSWKKLSGADKKIRKYNVSDSIFKKVINALYPLFFFRNYIGFDVVHFVNPFVFSNSLFTDLLLLLIKHFNKKITLSACGTEPTYVTTMLKLKYSAYSESEGKKLFSSSHRNRLNKVIKIVDGIIPVMYEYHLGYKDNIKCRNVIPLPVNVDQIPYEDNVIKTKIVIYHGIIREGFKGSKYIKEALCKLERNFPEQVEIIIKGQLPFSEYQEVLKRCNVLIDQCKSYSYGMNAIFGMAMGKVVMSGAEPEMLKSFGVTDHPIINITPDVGQIYTELVKLVSQQDSIIAIGHQSRQVALHLHSHTVIARQYITQWTLDE